MVERKCSWVVVGMIVMVIAGMFLFSGMALAANMIQNPGAEEIGEKGKPLFWGEYAGAEYGQWGVYTKDQNPENVYAGNSSVYYRIGFNKNGYANGGLVAADSNGYSGKKAYAVTPGVTYYYSFWLKATGYGREIRVIPWGYTADDQRIRPDDKSAQAGFTYIQIYPTNEWTKYSGSFVAPENAVTVAILFNSFGYLYKDYEEDVEFIVDEMYLSTQPDI